MKCQKDFRNLLFPILISGYKESSDCLRFFFIIIEKRIPSMLHSGEKHRSNVRNEKSHGGFPAVFLLYSSGKNRKEP